MTTLSNRVVKVETEQEAILAKLNDYSIETQRNRESIHSLRNTCNNTFNELRETHHSLNEIVLNNTHQITSLIEEQKEIKEVVKNNTVAMKSLEKSFLEIGTIAKTSIRIVSLISVLLGIYIMVVKIYV